MQNVESGLQAQDMPCLALITKDMESLRVLGVTSESSKILLMTSMTSSSQFVVNKQVTAAPFSAFNSSD